MNHSHKPPAWVDSLIDSLSPPDLSEEIRGDLYELFVKDILNKNIHLARRRYVLNGMGFLFKSFFCKKPSYHPKPTPMLTTHFKMARRSLSTQKGNTVINVLGLVAGIAATLVILAVVRFELSFDTSHTGADRIYRLVRVSGDDMSEFRTGISYPVPVAMKEEIPGLSNMAAMEYFGGANVDVIDPSGTALRKFREESGAVLIDA